MPPELSEITELQKTHASVGGTRARAFVFFRRYRVYAYRESHILETHLNQAVSWDGMLPPPSGHKLQRRPSFPQAPHKAVASVDTCKSQTFETCVPSLVISQKVSVV